MCIQAAYRICAVREAQHRGLVNVQLCTGNVRPEVVTRGKEDVSGVRYLRYRTRAKSLCFVTVLMMVPSLSSSRNRIGADPRGLSSGDTFQSVLMR